MRELDTIQKREKLNMVFATGDIGLGGSGSKYVVISDTGLQIPREQEIEFQTGPRDNKNSIHGVTDEDLLEIVRDRLQSFQSGSLSCRENACALTHIEEALMWLNKRKEDRLSRGVLGSYYK